MSMESKLGTIQAEIILARSRGEQGKVAVLEKVWGADIAAMEERFERELEELKKRGLVRLWDAVK